MIDMINIDRLMELLPAGYEEACYETKAIERIRAIKTPADLMKLCLIYLSQKCSLVEMSEIARLLNIGKMSDVAFMKRFSKCGKWFKWILEQIIPAPIANYEKPKKIEDYTVVAVDASDISEKGATKRIWRLHYAINLFTMTSQQYKITSEKTGESLTNFTIRPDYLVLGDRAYASKTGIEYCLKHGGNFIFRIRNKAFKLYDKDHNEMVLLEHLEKATDKEATDIEVYMKNSENEFVKLRICALKKTDQEIERNKHKTHRFEQRKQLKISEETKETHAYTFVITSLPESISAMDVLSLYRFRWQVELYFKRLKSIMDFGELPKKRNDSIEAWLNGKLIVALLVEKLLSEVDFFPSA